MEHNLYDKQSRIRLRSRNKRANYYNNGLRQVKNIIPEMEIPAKKNKLSEEKTMKKKRKSVSAEYVCSVCNAVFKRKRGFQIHERRGCEGQRSTSMIKVVVDVNVIPKILLERLAPEIVEKYSKRKEPNTKEAKTEVKSQSTIAILRRSCRQANPHPSSEKRTTVEPMNPESIILISQQSEDKHLSSESSIKTRQSSTALQKHFQPKEGTHEKLNNLPKSSPGNISNSFVCNICKTTFNREKDLHSHILSHTDRLKQHTLRRPFQCPICKIGFAIKSYLIRHVQFCKRKDDTQLLSRSKEITLTATCSMCNSEFKSDMELIDHMISHKNEPNFKDGETQSGQEEAKMLTEETQELSNRNPKTVDQKIFACKICNKEFGNVKSFAAHHRIHRTKTTKTFLNGLTGDSAINDSKSKIRRSAKLKSSKSGLNTIRTKAKDSHKNNVEMEPDRLTATISETRADPNQTEFDAKHLKKTMGAPKAYIRGPLKRKTFMGIFKCSTCSYSTKYFGSLSKHELQIHNRTILPTNTISLPKFIHCSLCDYATRYKCNLQSHQKRIHGQLGSKDGFYCLECAFNTANVSDWQNHQLQFHNVRPISTCKKCNFVFPSYYELKCHRMKHLRENTSCDSTINVPPPKEMPSPEEEIVEKQENHVLGEEKKVSCICQICGNKYPKQHFLDKHTKTVHPLENNNDLCQTSESEDSVISKPEPKANKVNKKHQCKLCSVVCINANALYKHMQRHSIV